MRVTSFLRASRRQFRESDRNMSSGNVTKQKPRVTIGLTVFNGEQFLDEAVRAFLNQTYRDFELIISDNASIDRTGEIARAWTAKDLRVRYSRNEKNLGLAGN